MILEISDIQKSFGAVEVSIPRSATGWSATTVPASRRYSRFSAGFIVPTLERFNWRARLWTSSLRSALVSPASR